MTNYFKTSQQEARITSTTNTTHHATEKHWCVISKKHANANVRRYIKHFPHTLEVLLPCWSYFREQEATNNCGLLFFGFDKQELGSWQTEFVRDGMGCEVEFLEQEDEYDTDTGNLILTNHETGTRLFPEGVYYVLNFYLLKPRYGVINYLDDKRDAHALRRKFVSDDYIASVKGKEKGLQIGIIQRPEGASRRIGNLPEIKTALQNDIPDATITITNFTYSTVKEQATWFATKDVIIAAHGAALANSFFITPKTVVLVVYPGEAYFPSLEPMIEQSGGVALDWYQQDIKNPFLAEGSLTNMQYNKMMHGSQEIFPVVDEIVARIHFALIQTPLWSDLKAVGRSYKN
jgi:hypothetical protein